MAARDAERDATRDAARDEARDVERDAGRDATRDAARDAARDAERDAARADEFTTYVVLPGSQTPAQWLLGFAPREFCYCIGPSLSFTSGAWAHLQAACMASLPAREMY